MVLKEITIIVQSYAEAGYNLASLYIQQEKWLKRIIEDFGEKQEALNIHYNNKSVIDMTKNQFYHERIKHIVIKRHFIREAIEDEEVQLSFRKTNELLIFSQNLFLEKKSKNQEKLWKFHNNTLRGNVEQCVISINVCIRNMFLEYCRSMYRG